MKKSFLSFAFIILLSYSAKSQDFDYSFMETFEVEGQANLTVSSYDSNIEVIAHEGDEIQVLYIVKKRNQLIKSTKEEIENLVSDQWKFDIEQAGDTLKLRVLSTVVKGYTDYKDAIDVHFKIYVPKDTSTNLYTSDGDILIQGLTSTQKCISSDGDIKLVDLTGKVYAQTSDGDIRMKNVTGVVETLANDGRVIGLKE